MGEVVEMKRMQMRKRDESLEESMVTMQKEGVGRNGWSEVEWH